MSPQTASSEELTLPQVAAAMGEPARTVRRWLQIWRSLGVEGIRVEPSRGRYGVRYLVARSLLDRWIACLLPPPRRSAA